ncbi:MAG: hypothetical protein P4L82_02255 [Ancalomicrobiaceae bacterium]|nr:hypothetical protein [Ancalomicrobiaceae bacterium]
MAAKGSADWRKGQACGLARRASCVEAKQNVVHSRHFAPRPSRPDLYGFLMRPTRLRHRSLTHIGATIRHHSRKERSMSDVVYLILGLALIGAMAVYANALTGA